MISNPSSPDFQPDSEWAKGEFLPAIQAGDIAPLPHCLKFSIRPDLPFRRIYFYIEAAFDVGAQPDFMLEGELCLWLRGAIVNRIPASEARDTVGALLKSSLFGIHCIAAISTDATSPVASAENAIKVITGNKFTNNRDTIILHPHTALGEWDQISYSLLNAKGGQGNKVTAIRAALLVQSLNYAY